MALFAVLRDAIDPRALEASVRTDACGAIVTFLGVVRGSTTDGRSIVGLEYEAHEAMALAEFAAIAQELAEQHPGVRLGILHRVGDLSVGEISVAVCAAAPHRREAFEACEYAIEALKARAPIWKKEAYIDGGDEWIVNKL